MKKSKKTENFCFDKLNLKFVKLKPSFIEVQTAYDLVVKNINKFVNEHLTPLSCSKIRDEINKDLPYFFQNLLVKEVNYFCEDGYHQEFEVIFKESKGFINYDN